MFRCLTPGKWPTIRPGARQPCDDGAVSGMWVGMLPLPLLLMMITVKVVLMMSEPMS